MSTETPVPVTTGTAAAMPAARPRGSRGPAPASRANIRDVARLAGVSATTVSRVFADSPSVRPATRERVMAAAEQLGYVVNGLAQAMMGRGRRSVAFLASHMIGPSFAAMAAGAESVATKHGNVFMLSTTGADREREASLMEILREQRAAGVLLVGATSTGQEFADRIAGYARDLETIGARLVLCGRPPLPEVPQVLTVDYDQAGGVRQAVSLLAAGGHRRIAFVGFEPAWSTPAQRLRGFAEGLIEAGVDNDESLIVTCENELEPAAVAASELLTRPDRPTAIVGYTDIVAVGVYRAARALGLAIPDDLAIVGFDDSPFVADLTPGLTTVRAPFRQVGAHGARLALGLDETAGHIILPTTLIVRGSTTEPPQKNAIATA